MYRKSKSTILNKINSQNTIIDVANYTTQKSKNNYN